MAVGTHKAQLLNGGTPCGKEGLLGPLSPVGEATEDLRVWRSARACPPHWDSMGVPYTECPLGLRPPRRALGQPGVHEQWPGPAEPAGVARRGPQARQAPLGVMASSSHETKEQGCVRGLESSCRFDPTWPPHAPGEWPSHGAVFSPSHLPGRPGPVADRWVAVAGGICVLE